MKIGKKGTFPIPANLRPRFGFEDGELVIAEEQNDSILLRPAIASPVEIYSDDRAAEFLLSNAADLNDYASAREEVLAMGMSPDDINHLRPDR